MLFEKLWYVVENPATKRPDIRYHRHDCGIHGFGAARKWLGIESCITYSMETQC